MVSVHYSMVTFMMSRFLFITAWLLLLCQGFCTLQYGCHWRRRNSVQGRVRSPYGDTEQERHRRTTGIHAGTSSDACRNHSHRFVCFSVTTGDQLIIMNVQYQALTYHIAVLQTCTCIAELTCMELLLVLNESYGPLNS